MRVRAFLLAEGKLREDPHVSDCSAGSLRGRLPCWIDVADADPEQVRGFLRPLDLSPVLLDRSLDKATDPGVVSAGGTILAEYPSAFDPETDRLAFLSIFLRGDLLVTVRHGAMPALDDLVMQLTGEEAPSVSRLSQLVYLVLDEFADSNARAQTAIRDDIQVLAKAVAESPASVRADRLSRLRWQVGNLVAVIEDQLYCISGLAASDSELLRDSHRTAFLDDLRSETEIAQRGVYRLETRVNDLYRDYQMVASDRMERRLRVLTVVSAITLPLGLVTGLLGMNVGGIPGTSVWFAFLVVVIVMLVIFLVEFWYFKRKGWFD